MSFLGIEIAVFAHLGYSERNNNNLGPRGISLRVVRTDISITEAKAITHLASPAMVSFRGFILIFDEHTSHIYVRVTPGALIMN